MVTITTTGRAANFNPLPPCGGRLLRHLRREWIKYFNPLPPCGGRQIPPDRFRRRQGISIHSLRVEGDACVIQVCLTSNISIHSLRVEGDQSTRSAKCSVLEFQSTPSVWRETKSFCYTAYFAEFQSTPSVWRETCIVLHVVGVVLFQSTPSVWRETLTRIHCKKLICNFNPLPPCGGRQHRSLVHSNIQYFNPLPPCGGRRYQMPLLHRIRNFNPLPPCGGRQ